MLDPQQAGKMMPEPRPSLMIGNTVVKPSATHKFLGVLFNQELCWKEQAERVVAKATKWTLNVHQLAKLAKGISPCQMWQLYQAVVVPCFTYVADVWFMPVQRDTNVERAQGSVGVARKLTSVQCMASTAVTGACAQW